MDFMGIPSTGMGFRGLNSLYLKVFMASIFIPFFSQINIINFAIFFRCSLVSQIC